MTKVFQELTCNFSKSKKVRHATMDGDEYLVAPVVLLTHDVLEGSNGPVYYPESSLADYPSRWDHKPIVVNHPKNASGKLISACDPVVLEAFGCGMFLNTAYHGKAEKLRSETWFNKKKTAKVNDKVFTALEEGKMMEASTGLLFDLLDEPGTFRGKQFRGSAFNFAPDHLAILPDTIGACSIAKGGGLLQVNEAGHVLLTNNEMSFDRIRQAVSSALEEQMGYSCYVRDLYDGFLAYTNRKGLWKVSYAIDKDGTVTLGTEATPVQWVTEYRTVDKGEYVGNQEDSKETKPVDKKAQIDFLITANSGWSEDDRKTLEGFPDTTVKRLHDAAQAKKVEPTPLPPPVVPVAAAPAPVPAVVGNAAVPVSIVATPVSKPGMTFNDFLATAPAEYQEMVAEGVEVSRQERTRLITAITANSSNKFSAEYLQTQKLEVLRNIAAFAAPEQQSRPQNYAGAATISANSAPKEVKPLEEIEMVFTRNGK